MNCWETLGIEPTHDTTRIRDAFERQSKFAEGEEARQLQDAYQQALEEAGEPPSQSSVENSIEPSSDPSVWQSENRRAPLSATERQVVREVVIQVNAMLNDSVRIKDVAIWRAILTEPPADQDALRSAIGDELEPTLRPMAEKADLSAPVARFLGDWFGWYGMTDALETESRTDEALLEDAGRYQGISFPDTGDSEAGDNDGKQRPQMTNFWPAVIGWVVGIVLLTSLFGALTGGG